MLFRTPALRRCSAVEGGPGGQAPLSLFSFIFLFLPFPPFLSPFPFHLGPDPAGEPPFASRQGGAPVIPAGLPRPSPLTLGSATCRPASVAAQPPPTPAGCRADRSRPAVRPGHRAGCRQLQPVLDQGVLTRILANLEQLRHAVFPVARGKNKAGARAPQFSVCLAVLRRCGFNIAQDVALRVCNDRSFYMNECNSEGQPKREKELGQVSRIRLNL